MIALVRAGLSDSWEKLIPAVEEALRLGVTDEGAVMRILRMPDLEDRPSASGIRCGASCVILHGPESVATCFFQFLPPCRAVHFYSTGT
jgi:hypothetical protein